MYGLHSCHSNRNGFISFTFPISYRLETHKFCSKPISSDLAPVVTMIRGIYWPFR